MRKMTMYAWGVAILCFVVLMIVIPTYPRDQAYHDFADPRQFFGIPNMLNVVSNFPFLVISVIGLVLCFYGNYLKSEIARKTYGRVCFYIGVATVAFGSLYYHLKPNDARLVWDRLPMIVAFTLIITIFVIERIDERKGSISIIPRLLAGFYLLVKAEEATDKPVYNWTHHIVSGHTLKYLCAILVPVFHTLMLAERTIKTERLHPVVAVG